MADKLALYNQALLLLGQRSLRSTAEPREPRYLLDNAYDFDAEKHCLEMVQPHFAAYTTKLTTYTSSSSHDLDNVYLLPSDYVATIKAYSDPELSEEISRYTIDGEKLSCDYSTVYLRYTRSGRSITFWSAGFLQVMAAWLAAQIAIKVDPDKAEAMNTLFQERVKTVRAIEQEKDSKERAPQTTATLTNTWRHIYNDALLILGLRKITTNNDDSYRRAVLDTTLDAGLVADMLEETGWIFALQSEEIDYDPSISTEFGYTYGFAKPTDIHRLHGIFQDEYMRVPLRRYIDENSYWFADISKIYVQYVDTSWLTTPDAWPAFFKRLVAAKMAKDAAMSLRNDGADPDRAEAEFQARRREALGNDAVSAPPKIFSTGSWVNSRWRRDNRGRP